MANLIVRDCDVLRLEGGHGVVLEHQDILVAGQFIEAVKPTVPDASPSADVQVIDGRGMLAMPGLMNTHAHVPMVLFRGLAEDVSVVAWFNEYI